MNWSLEKMSKEYYEGMFSSLKHNIFLMLNQIEGNIEYSKGADFLTHLEAIESRIKDIKEKHIWEKIDFDEFMDGLTGKPSKYFVDCTLVKE